MRVVRRAAGARHSCAERARVGEQLVDEARLPEPGLADDRDDVASSGERFVESAKKLRHLLIAADERRPAAVRRRGLDAEEPPRDERRGLALRGDRRMWLVCEET